MISTTQIKVAKEKEEHPERFCPTRKCLWRTDGVPCPLHKKRTSSPSERQTDK